MFGLGVTELVIILVVALIIFGPGKLPEIGGALGKGIRDFRKSVDSVGDEVPAAKLDVAAPRADDAVASQKGETG